MKQRDRCSPENKLSDPLSPAWFEHNSPTWGQAHSLSLGLSRAAVSPGHLRNTALFPDGNPGTAQPRDSEDMRLAFFNFLSFTKSHNLFL